MSERTPHVAPQLSASGSLAPEYFDRLYAQSADPWEFETSAYEAEKYAATLAALPRPIYENALELGCSIGVLTRQLATRCAALLAVDASRTALDSARERCADQRHVQFDCLDVAIEFPRGSFDLILVSEIGYYFSESDLLRLRERIASALRPGGHLLLVHYTGKTNYPLTAETVHAAFLDRAGADWTRLAGHRTEQYRLDLIASKASAYRSPAEMA